MMAISLEWLAADKAIDPDFVGSIWEEMGYDDKLCPACGAHLHNGICLNACHLTKRSREKFGQLMKQMMEERSDSDG